MANYKNKEDMNMKITPDVIEYFFEYAYAKVPDSFKENSLSREEQVVNYMNSAENK